MKRRQITADVESPKRRTKREVEKQAKHTKKEAARQKETVVEQKKAKDQRKNVRDQRKNEDQTKKIEQEEEEEEQEVKQESEQEVEREMEQEEEGEKSEQEVCMKKTDESGVAKCMEKTAEQKKLSKNEKTTVLSEVYVLEMWAATRITSLDLITWSAGKAFPQAQADGTRIIDAIYGTDMYGTVPYRPSPFVLDQPLVFTSKITERWKKVFPEIREQRDWEKKWWYCETKNIIMEDIEEGRQRLTNVPSLQDTWNSSKHYKTTYRFLMQIIARSIGMPLGIASLVKEYANPPVESSDAYVVLQTPAPLGLSQDERKFFITENPFDPFINGEIVDARSAATFVTSTQRGLALFRYLTDTGLFCRCTRHVMKCTKKFKYLSVWTAFFTAHGGSNEQREQRKPNSKERDILNIFLAQPVFRESWYLHMTQQKAVVSFFLTQDPSDHLPDCRFHCHEQSSE